MAFETRFPMTTWAWRHATAPATRKILGIFVLTVLVLSTVFRLEAMRFQSRVSEILLRLRQVDAGRTTQTDLLHLLPQLRAEKANAPDTSQTEEYAFGFDTLSSNRLIQRLQAAIYENSYLWRLAYAVGYRPGSLYVYATVHDGVVMGWSYAVSIAPPRNYHPGAVRVRVSCHTEDQAQLQRDSDELPFHFDRYFKWPEWDLHVWYSPDAPEYLKNASFEVNLSCMWSLRGCYDAAQLLPALERVRLNQITRGSN